MAKKETTKGEEKPVNESKPVDVAETAKGKKPVVPPKAVFTKIADKLPNVKSHSPVASSSAVLSIQTKDGKTVFGKYQRWDRDMNAPHIQAKKGDGFFHDLNDRKIDNAVAWKSSVND